MDAGKVAQRMRGDHPLRSDLPDDASNIPPQVLTDLESAVGVAEESDVGHAYDLGSRPLLGLPMPAISERGTAGSKPPASPLVTRQYDTSMRPWSTMRPIRRS